MAIRSASLGYYFIFATEVDYRLYNSMNNFSSFWQQLGKFKYLIIIAFFVTHLAFIDDNNLVKRQQCKQEIRELKQEIKYYQEENDKSIKLLEELNSNPEVLERIARERYYMKKDNEDIYIFE